MNPPSEQLQEMSNPYPPERILNEEERDEYYEYDLDLIQSVLHNCSFAGFNNPNPAVRYSVYGDAIITRSPTEHLSIGTGTDNRSVLLTVSDPTTEDSYHESTAIYLSMAEIRVLYPFLREIIRQERNATALAAS